MHKLTPLINRIYRRLRQWFLSNPEEFKAGAFLAGAMALTWLAPE